MQANEFSTALRDNKYAIPLIFMVNLPRRNNCRTLVCLIQYPDRLIYLVKHALSCFLYPPLPVAMQYPPDIATVKSVLIEHEGSVAFILNFF